MTARGCWDWVEPGRALEALAAHAPDAFLTPAVPGMRASGLIGLWPRAQWRLDPAWTPEAARADLARFCADAGGPVLGYLGYGAGLAGLGLPGLDQPDQEDGFPPGVFRAYHALLAPTPDGRGLRLLAGRSEDVRRIREAFAAHAPLPGSSPGLAPRLGGGLRASLDAHGYRAAVRRALNHILDGDVYQLNLSIRFAADWPGDLTPQALFAHLLRTKPAPFYVLFDTGGHVLCSTSPERFLQVRRGRVLSQPIKGTRAAGPDPSASARELLASAKEDAELSMIVDLIRNDISPHCAYGSVGVRGHKSLTLADGLWQMYANVTGRMRPGSTALDLLWDALPPGSVTGCPKARAAEIIAALEPHRRGPYCGCLALIHGPNDLDSSVAIRTAVLDRNAREIVFHAGSGIVVDSDPEAEYRETLAKAAKFLNLIPRREP